MLPGPGGRGLGARVTPFPGAPSHPGTHSGPPRIIVMSSVETVPVERRSAPPLVSLMAHEAPEECLCVRCAARQGSCCARREIYLTPGDIRRMSAFLGRSDFHGRRSAGHPDYLPDGTDPDWERYVFGPEKERSLLLPVKDGPCGFLGPRGCVFPMDVRPLVCRLYPWEYNHEGLLGLSGDCPRDLLRPGESLLAELGMADAAEVGDWHRMLYAEMREEREPTCSAKEPSAPGAAAGLGAPCVACSQVSTP